MPYSSKDCRLFNSSIAVPTSASEIQTSVSDSTCHFTMHVTHTFLFGCWFWEVVFSVAKFCIKVWFSIAFLNTLAVFSKWLIFTLRLEMKYFCASTVTWFSAIFEPFFCPFLALNFLFPAALQLLSGLCFFSLNMLSSNSTSVLSFSRVFWVNPDSLALLQFLVFAKLSVFEKLLKHLLRVGFLFICLYIINYHYKIDIYMAHRWVSCQLATTTHCILRLLLFHH